jgi:hypothetical protein
VRMPSSRGLGPRGAGQHVQRHRLKSAPNQTFSSARRFIAEAPDDGKENLRTGGYWRGPPLGTWRNKGAISAPPAGAHGEEAPRMPMDGGSWQEFRAARSGVRHVTSHLDEHEHAHGEAIPQCYFGFSSYGQGPGAYWPDTDTQCVVRSRPPKRYLCPRCCKSGHWEFDCPRRRAVQREHAGLGTDESSVLHVEEAHTEGAGAKAKEDYVCKQNISPQCWKVGRWQVEKELVEESGFRPPSTRHCHHCLRTGHFTHDCHRIGTNSRDRDKDTNLRIGVCPCCRLARVRQRLNASKAAEACFVEKQEDAAPRHPSFHRCRNCGGKHFLCDCPHRADDVYEIPIRNASAVAEGQSERAHERAEDTRPDTPPPPKFKRLEIWKSGSAKHLELWKSVDAKALGQQDKTERRAASADAHTKCASGSVLEKPPNYYSCTLCGRQGHWKQACPLRSGLTQEPQRQDGCQSGVPGYAVKTGEDLPRGVSGWRVVRRLDGAGGEACFVQKRFSDDQKSFSDDHRCFSDDKATPRGDHAGGPAGRGAGTEGAGAEECRLDKPPSYYCCNVCGRSGSHWRQNCSVMRGNLFSLEPYRGNLFSLEPHRGDKQFEQGCLCPVVGASGDGASSEQTARSFLYRVEALGRHKEAFFQSNESSKAQRVGNCCVSMPAKLDRGLCFSGLGPDVVLLQVATQAEKPSQATLQQLEKQGVV